VTLTFSLLTGALGIFGTVTLALSLGDFPEGNPCYREGDDGKKK
jgi:hypothetical protein